MKKKFGTPEEVGADFAIAHKTWKDERRPLPPRVYESAQEVLDEVRKVLGTPEGECVIEHAKKVALKYHG
jgi:hypothetical protein